MKSSVSGQKNHPQRVILGMMAATSFLMGCSQENFSLTSLSGTHREYQRSAQLEQRIMVSENNVSGGSPGMPEEAIIPPPSETILPVPECVVGAFDLYHDKNLDDNLTSDERIAELSPFHGRTDVITNYNYRKASGSPLVGPKPEPFKSKVFLFADSQGTHLNMINNIKGKIGSSHNRIDWKIATSGNGGRDQVLLADDKLELNHVATAMSDHQGGGQPEEFLAVLKIYKARWEYWHNTDGGIIGPFVNNTSTSIRIDMAQLGDIKGIEFASASGQAIKIKNPGKPLRFYLKAREVFSQPMPMPIATALPMAKSDTAISNDTVVSNDSISSPINFCEPKDPIVAVRLNPVQSVEQVLYPSPCDSNKDLYCPAVIRAPDYVVKGLSQVSRDLPAGQATTVKFGQLHTKCGETAKKAMAEKRPLLISGRVSGVTGPVVSSGEELHFSEILRCELSDFVQAQ